MYASEPDKKLVRRLNIIHLQSVICEKENDILMSEFFEIMRQIIIEARLYKWDNNIPDELNDMEKALAEMELMEKKEKARTKALKKTEEKAATSPEKVTKPQNIQKENEPPERNADEQLSLF